MCDTFAALGSATKEGNLIFGKNSDRPFNEPQPVVFFPEKSFPSDAQVSCTYISIPQVETTKAVLLSKPTWMWGAEMGANDKVVIGNEAVWTKEKDGPTALIGMDLLRLALERSSSALNAVQIITSLLEEHGQGGGRLRHRGPLRERTRVGRCRQPQSQLQVDERRRRELHPAIRRDAHGAPPVRARLGEVEPAGHRRAGWLRRCRQAHAPLASRLVPAGRLVVFQ